jgi:hypothetical protein
VQEHQEVQEIQELVVQAVQVSSGIQVKWNIRKFRNTGAWFKWFIRSKWIKRCRYIRKFRNTGVSSSSSFIRKYRS